jgi:hypothetical protein
MWCKAFTTRYISKKRHKKRIIGIWLFLFKANSPFLVEALDRGRNGHQMIKCFVIRDGEFRCSRYRYLYVLYKYTMLTTSCIIPWDIGFVDPPISSKI